MLSADKFRQRGCAGQRNRAHQTMNSIQLITLAAWPVFFHCIVITTQRSWLTKRGIYFRH